MLCKGRFWINLRRIHKLLTSNLGIQWFNRISWTFNRTPERISRLDLFTGFHHCRKREHWKIISYLLWKLWISLKFINSNYWLFCCLRWILTAYFTKSVQIHLAQTVFFKHLHLPKHAHSRNQWHLHSRMSTRKVSQFQTMGSNKTKIS